jgi:16S rRNA (guanine1207-N2)-methyltransferase
MQIQKVSPYPQESLLIDALSEMKADRLLCTSAGLAQFASEAVRALGDATVTCTYLDQYRAHLAQDYWRDPPSNLNIECATDLPPAEADIVALPFSAAGEAELTRDLLQAGHERLKIGGRLYASTNNPHDTWLREQASKLFRKIERREKSDGALYIATKTEPLKKLKNFACEFAFRDRGRLIRACSRPGVFSHRHLDTGARRLMDAMELKPADRVLDIGCGSGAVALAAASCGPSIVVHAVDSNARAIECTQRGASLNALTNITTELNAFGRYAGAGTFDIALANPPYYSSFRIAEHFLTAARHALRVGGGILVVTKTPDWYAENCGRWYHDVAIVEQKGYFLVQAVRPPGP